MYKHRFPARCNWHRLDQLPGFGLTSPIPLDMISHMDRKQNAEGNGNGKLYLKFISLITSAKLITIIMLDVFCRPSPDLPVHLPA